MIPTADIIAKLLVDLGLAAASSGSPWPVFISFFPDTPDTALCVLDTAGRQDGRLMGTGEVIEFPGFQIIVRAQIYPDARDRAGDIAEKIDLEGFKRTVVLPSAKSYYVQNISRSGAVIPLGMDQAAERRRYLFSLNGTITAEEQ